MLQASVGAHQVQSLTAVVFGAVIVVAFLALIVAIRDRRLARETDENPDRFERIENCGGACCDRKH